ncbi:MAG: hypothetical protein HFJ72_08355 [Adlercreutzia sp.]|nr:hypothetical protein [Adlercreutzia sp.]
MRPSRAALEAALGEFGACWEWDGFFGIPAADGQAEYVAVLDSEETLSSDDGALAMERHSVTLELYDSGGPACRARRRELSRILRAANIQHTRASPTHIPSQRKNMTAYYLDSWLEAPEEKGTADG